MYLWNRWIFYKYLHNWWFLQMHQYHLLDFYDMSLCECVWFFFGRVFFFFFSQFTLPYCMYAYSVGGYFTCTCMEGEVLHVSAVEGVAFTCLYLDMCGNALFYWFYMFLPNNRWLFCLYEVVQTLWVAVLHACYSQSLFWRPPEK